MSQLCPLIATLALAIAPPALAQEPTPRVAETQHAGTFNGQAVSYTATVAESFLHDAKGAPTASVITTTYVRDGVADALSLDDGDPRLHWIYLQDCRVRGLYVVRIQIDAHSGPAFRNIDRLRAR